MVGRGTFEAKLRLARVAKAQRRSTVDYRIGDRAVNAGKRYNSHPILDVSKTFVFKCQMANVIIIKFTVALEQFHEVRVGELKSNKD